MARIERAGVVSRGIIAGAYRLGKDLHAVVEAAGLGHIGFYHLTIEQGELVYRWLQEQESEDAV